MWGRSAALARLGGDDWRGWVTTGKSRRRGIARLGAPDVDRPTRKEPPMSASVSTPGPSQDVRPVHRALVSVYDKTGLEGLVRGLHEAGVALVSTGGSAALIESLGLPVTKVEDLTGFPECLEGRVKTLHPRVHAGILADRRLDPTWRSSRSSASSRSTSW